MAPLGPGPGCRSHGARGGGVDDGARETGDEVPLRHQAMAEEVGEKQKKRKRLEGKVKVCCSGIKSKLLLQLPTSRLRQRSGWEKGRRRHRK